jgi:hypothetical protein
MAGSAKAVADGAAAWYIRRSVTSRATRFAYGAVVRALYNISDWRHRGRIVYKDCDGDRVHGVWSATVAKVSLYDNGTNAIMERRGRIAVSHLMICNVQTIGIRTRHQNRLWGSLRWCFTLTQGVETHHIM